MALHNSLDLSQFFLPVDAIQISASRFSLGICWGQSMDTTTPSIQYMEFALVGPKYTALLSGAQFSDKIWKFLEFENFLGSHFSNEQATSSRRSPNKIIFLWRQIKSLINYIARGK